MSQRHQSRFPERDARSSPRVRARRRRRAARTDLCIGAGVAMLALIFGPGLGILTLLALLVLGSAVASAFIRRARSPTRARSHLRSPQHSGRAVRHGGASRRPHRDDRPAVRPEVRRRSAG
jgi:hypothetical protein